MTEMMPALGSTRLRMLASMRKLTCTGTGRRALTHGVIGTDSVRVAKVLAMMAFVIRSKPITKMPSKQTPSQRYSQEWPIPARTATI